MKSFQKRQLAFTHYLRTKDAAEKTGVPEQREKSIYRDLVFKNISRLIGDSFPITRNIIADADWQIIIQDFIATHCSKTPFFLEVCQEFLAYLIDERQPLATDHPIMLELAHFEWIQLALDISDAELPAQHNFVPTETSEWQASPLALGLSYSYPVHLTDECNIPDKVNPTHLIVYRDREDHVNLLVTDALHLRIMQLLHEHQSINCPLLHQILSKELHDHQPIIKRSELLLILCELAKQEIIFFE